MGLASGCDQATLQQAPRQWRDRALCRRGARDHHEPHGQAARPGRAADWRAAAAHAQSACAGRGGSDRGSCKPRPDLDASLWPPGSVCAGRAFLQALCRPDRARGICRPWRRHDADGRGARGRAHFPEQGLFRRAVRAALAAAGLACARHHRGDACRAARRSLRLHAAGDPSAARSPHPPDGDVPRGDVMSAPGVAELVAALPARAHVLITGATGFIGRRLTEALVAASHDVTVLLRDPARAVVLRPPFRLVTSLDQIDSGAAIDAVVNLAGEPVANGRWTRAKRRRILSSRLRMTRRVVQLIARLHRKPSVLVSASAIGWYGLWQDEELTEFDGGKRSFMHRVCEAWECAAKRAQRLGTRVVRLRIGIVLAAEGGLLARLLLPFRLGLGGSIGQGKQWISWIERDD